MSFAIPYVPSETDTALRMRRNLRRAKPEDILLNDRDSFLSHAPEDNLAKNVHNASKSLPRARLALAWP